MEREANYAAVGAFVLAVTLCTVLFVYWYSEGRETRHYQRYEIYFTGSVSGLERGGSVRYLGVSVGRVINMDIDDRDAGRVKVTVDIASTTPIRQDKTIAELNWQGLTGLLYIDLRNKSANEHPELVPSESYPVIRSVPSELPEIVADARSAIARANRLLSDSNLDSVSSMLANLDQGTRGLPQTMRDMNALVVDLRHAAAEVEATSEAAHSMLQGVSPQLTASVERFHSVADNLARATAQLDQTISENHGDVTTFIHTGLPELERLLQEGRDAAAQIKALSVSLRQNPSQLIYQPATDGVEIPR
jgi:phospholipid/cholesterol/gamma-HCH transport system substrate-binding protein